MHKTLAIRPIFDDTEQRTRATPLVEAAQLEATASHLRQAAYALEDLHIVENVSYWEWKSKQEDARDRHQPFNALPMEFTHWLLLDEAAQLESRARELRGER